MNIAYYLWLFAYLLSITTNLKSDLWSLKPQDDFEVETRW